MITFGVGINFKFSNILFNSLAIIIVYIFTTTPLALLFMGVIALLFGNRQENYTRIFFLACIVVSMALIYASREFGGSYFDDFKNIYYPLYLDAKKLNFIEFIKASFFEFSISKLEVGFQVLVALLALFPTELSPAFLIFIFTLISGLMYMWWLTKYLLPDIAISHRSSSALFCAIFFSYGLCSQTTRQMLSIPLLLAAIWEPRFGKSLLLTIAASSFHLSAALVVMIFMALRKFGYKALIFLGILMLFLYVNGAELINVVIGFDISFIDKLNYYTDGNLDAEGYDGNFIPLISFVFILSLFVKNYRDGHISRLVLFFCFLFFVLLPFPLASFRVTLFITAALMAPMVCLTLFQRLSSGLYALLIFIISMAMIMRRIFVIDISSGMSLWYLFSPVELMPFMYLIKIVGY